MVTLMPVDHRSSRMVEEEEADEWVEVKSREISQYYDDDDLDQIITELPGGGEWEAFGDASKEAEICLKCASEEAGLDESLDKTTLSVQHQTIESLMCIADETVDREWRAYQGINTSQQWDR